MPKTQRQQRAAASPNAQAGVAVRANSGASLTVRLLSSRRGHNSQTILFFQIATLTIVYDNYYLFLSFILDSTLHFTEWDALFS